MKISERIYRRLPRIGQHAATTVQGGLYYLTRYAGTFHSEHHLLGATEFANAELLHDIQSARLRDMIRFAFDYVPHYRDQAKSMGIGAADIRCAEDLKVLPLTLKEDLRKRPLEFRAEYAFSEPLIRWTTSGTTGKPLELVYTRSAVRNLYAFVELYREAAGLHRRSRRAQFTGKVVVPETPNENTFWRYDLANNAMLLSLTHLHPNNLGHYLNAMQRWGVEYICGYPSAIALLAQQCLLENRTIPLKAVLTTAETFAPVQRENIESAFRTRVYDQYGQAEMQSFWYECPMGRMHIHPLAGVTEILREDGSPAEFGEQGNIVLTGLVNRAMPLIRYRIGDLAARSGESCICGRQMPIIERIDGRLEDYLYTRERGFVARLDPVFKGVTNIVESQLVQENLDRILLRYVPAPDFTTRDLTLLIDRLRGRLGYGIELATVPVEYIPRGANGKFRAVLSHVRREDLPRDVVQMAL